MSLVYPLSTAEIRHKRRDLAPSQQAAFEAFSKAVFPTELFQRKSSRLLRWQ
jgi:hypothetical protein